MKLLSGPSLAFSGVIIRVKVVFSLFLSWFRAFFAHSVIILSVLPSYQAILKKVVFFSRIVSQNCFISVFLGVSFIL